MRRAVAWLLIGGLAVALGFSAEQKRPDWVDKIPNRPDLLQGVGVAEDTGNPEADQKRAEVNAITQIINEISTTVSSQLTDFMQEDSRGGQQSNLETITRITAQYAQGTISGIKIKERYFDPKRKVYYAYATLSQEELQRQFRSRADNVTRLVRDYHLYAQQARAEDKVYDTLNNYCKALAEFFIVQASLKQKVEGDIDGVGKQEFLQVRLENEIAGILRQVQCQTISGSQQSAQRNRGLSQPLTGKVFINKEDQQLPLANIPIQLRLVNATGKVSEGLTTDATGQFTGYVNQIESAQAAVGMVKAGPYFPEIVAFQSQLPSLSALLEQTACTFTFQIDVQSSVRFCVFICEDVDGNAVARASSAGEIIKALVQNKFTVITPAQITPPIKLADLDFAVRFEDYPTVVNLLQPAVDYAVVGTLAIEQVEVSSGVLYFSKADARIKVIDLKSGREVAAIVQNGIKGAGADWTGANKDALKKCTQAVVQELIDDLKAALK